MRAGAFVSKRREFPPRRGNTGSTDGKAAGTRRRAWVSNEAAATITAPPVCGALTRSRSLYEHFGILPEPGKVSLTSIFSILRRVQGQTASKWLSRDTNADTTPPPKFQVLRNTGVPQPPSCGSGLERVSAPATRRPALTLNLHRRPRRQSRPGGRLRPGLLFR